MTNYPPARIVSLSPNITEILFALGLDEKIVAVSGDSDYPPQAAGKVKIGTFWQPDIEAVIAAKPDLVITEYFEQQKAIAESLSRLGYKILSLKIEKIDGLRAAIRQIGDAAGCRVQADGLDAAITKDMDGFRAANRTLSGKRVRVLWVVQNEPVRAAGRNTFIDELIELAGGENAIGETLQQYPSVSTEELLNCAAEVIIISGMGKEDLSLQQERAKSIWSRWPSLPAVKSGRIFVVDPDTVVRLGPRFCHGIDMIRKHLYPDTAEQKGR